MNTEAMNVLQSKANEQGQQVIFQSWTTIKAANNGEFVNIRLHWVTGEAGSQSFCILSGTTQAGHKLAKALYAIVTGVPATSVTSHHISGHEKDTDSEMWITGLEVLPTPDAQCQAQQDATEAGVQPCLGCTVHPCPACLVEDAKGALVDATTGQKTYGTAWQVAEDLAAAVKEIDPSWAKVIPGPHASVTVFGEGPFKADAIVVLEGLTEASVMALGSGIVRSAEAQGYFFEPISVFHIGIYDHRSDAQKATQHVIMDGQGTPVMLATFTPTEPQPQGCLILDQDAKMTAASMGSTCHKCPAGHGNFTDDPGGRQHFQACHAAQAVSRANGHEDPRWTVTHQKPMGTCLVCGLPVAGHCCWANGQPIHQGGCMDKVVKASPSRFPKDAIQVISSVGTNQGYLTPAILAETPRAQVTEGYMDVANAMIVLKNTALYGDPTIAKAKRVLAANGITEPYNTLMDCSTCTTTLNLVEAEALKICGDCGPGNNHSGRQVPKQDVALKLHRTHFNPDLFHVTVDDDAQPWQVGSITRTWDLGRSKPIWTPILDGDKGPEFKTRTGALGWMTDQVNGRW
jgi:hypothetical protein